MKMNNKKGKSGFTLVEIIAVLVIIGIMAAVAAPKFINLASEARKKAAWAGINEAKATLSVAYAKAYLENKGSDPDLDDVLGAANFEDNQEVLFGDVGVKLKKEGNDKIKISATQYDGVQWQEDEGPSDYWELPTQE